MLRALGYLTAKPVASEDESGRAFYTLNRPGIEYATSAHTAIGDATLTACKGPLWILLTGEESRSALKAAIDVYTLFRQAVRIAFHALGVELLEKLVFGAPERFIK